MPRREANRYDAKLLLIAIVIWTALLVSLININAGSKRLPASGQIDSLALAIRPSVKPRTIGAQTNADTAEQTAIAPWKGPVQPVIVQPSDKAPAFARIPTTEPVIFVGIDDGWVQTPEALNWLTEHHLPFTLFLTNNGISNNYDYFKQLQSAGMAIQNHTLSHPHMPKLNLEQQKTEICATADTYQRVFGRRPTLFRPPYGELNDTTRQAATACGMKALVLWHVVIGTGGDVQFQVGNNHLQPGDIVLMHFRPEFISDIEAFAKQVEQNHLQVGRLEDWIL